MVGESDGVSVGTDGNAIVVTIPSDVDLDLPEARAINREFMEAVRRDEITAAMTVMETESVLSSRAFREVEDAAAAGFGQGVERWAIVVRDPSEAVTFSDHVVGIETEIFEEREVAEAWLSEVG